MLNHFTGRETINLPYFFHKTLTKMARQVQAKPSKIASRISHQGLITLMIKELLKKRSVDWNHFLFWNEFPTELASEEAVKQGKGKKISTPKTSKRKRRAISPQAQMESPSSSSKRRRSKRKLVFEQAEETPQGKNPLNLPYSESESKDEKTQGTKQPMQEEQSQDLLLSNVPGVESSTSKTNKINMLL